jgi:hypothetical protein
MKRRVGAGPFTNLVAGDTFTVADIAEGNVQYVDPGTDDALLQFQQNTTASFSWRVSDDQGAVAPSATGAFVTNFTITSVDDPPVVSWRAMRCDADGIDIPADPITSITDVDTALTEYTLCVVSIENGTMSTTGGGETTVIPNLQNATVSLTVGGCVPLGARPMLNLDNSAANTGRGKVQWQLKIGAVPILGGAIISFPATPTSC